MDDIVNSLRVEYTLIPCGFCMGWPPGPKRNLGCYLYHSEKKLTHPTPPGLTELLIVRNEETARFTFTYPAEMQVRGVQSNQYFIQSYR